MPEKAAKQSDRFRSKPKVGAVPARRGKASFPGPKLPADAHSFCIENDLAPHIPVMLEQIQMHLDAVGKARFDLVTDPETDETYLRVGITVAGDVVKIADAYDKYIAASIKTFPPHVANAIRISLSVA